MKSVNLHYSKKEKIHMSKSLTNRLYLKKQLYGLKMSERSDIRDHINQFNKCITQSLSLEVKIEDEDHAIILLSFLLKSYEILVTTLSIGKTTSTVDEVSLVLLETKNIKEPSSLSHGNDRVLTVKFDSDHARSKSREKRYNDRKDNRSQSRL